jgi:uncharacterized protein GlcG (DUF336 family)
MTRAGLRVTIITLASTCALAAPAGAQLATHKDLTASIAIAIVQTTIETCKANGYKVSSTVVGRNGEIVAQVRGDDTGPHTIENSFRKATPRAHSARPRVRLKIATRPTRRWASSISATSSPTGADCRSWSATMSSAGPLLPAHRAARKTKPASRPHSTKWPIS